MSKASLSYKPNHMDEQFDYEIITASNSAETDRKLLHDQLTRLLRSE